MSDIISGRQISKKTVCKRALIFMHKLCYEDDYYVELKKILGFVYGLLLGLAFHELILVDLNFTENAAFLVTVIISLMLAFGIAFSIQIRCITLLSIPMFAGRAGRGNLTNNGLEVVRVFSCTTSLTFNMTKTRFELMFKPFSQALFGMKTEVNEVKDTIRSIRDVSAPIVGEIEDQTELKKLKEENDYIDKANDDSKRSKEIDDKYKTKGEQTESERFEKMYMKKIEMRCEDQFARAAANCRKMFEKGYDNCYDTVTWLAAWLLCWPMKLTFVCNIVQALGGANKCDPAKDLDPGFGEGYTYLKKSRSTLSENFKDVKLQYQLIKVKQLIDVRQASDTAKAVLHTVKRKKSLLDQLLVLLKRILAFIFLRIILSAQEYHDKYLRDIEFDNIYITKYFKHIDARRHRQEKKTLFPLKKIERIKLVDPFTYIPLKSERKKLLGETIKLLLEMITATTFILLDRLFYEALDLVRRHARIDYMQTGRHDMMLQVKGTGLIASMLRSVVKGFNIKKRIKKIQSNEPCLPRPTVLPNYYLYKIYGTYFLVWLLLVVQTYTQRLRRVICSMFYRRREKKRVLFLYNETLKRRIGFFKHMKNKVKKMARERRLQENLNIFNVLRIRFPKACSCLRFFPMARRRCIVCAEPEPRTGGDFVDCPNPTCYFIYCGECWFDVGKQCLVCLESTSDESDYQESDEGYCDSD